jgi:predicted HicB family RNase H-like nuclease
MKRDLKFYMSLDYPVEIRRLSEEDGGGYLACIPYLGRWMFTAAGDTIEEALHTLEEVKRDHFERLLSEGKEILLPPPVDADEHYSGRFLVRIPRHLHRRLAQLAELEGCSLNQYVTTLLAEASTAEWLEKVYSLPKPTGRGGSVSS